MALTSGGSGGGGTKNADAPAFRTIPVARSSSTPLPAPISGESAVAMRGGPLILGGLDSAGASVGGVFQLDAASDRVHEAGALAGPLHDAAAVVLGDRVLVFGGGTENSTDAVQALPTQGGELAPGTAAVQVGRLPTVRSDLSAVALGGRAYVLGGYDGTRPIDSVLETADGRSFNQVTALPAPARYMAVATLGGKIYAFGGEIASGSGSDAIQAIDPRAGTARVVGHLPQAISHAGAVVLGGRVYVLGGETGGSADDSIWRFNPDRGTVSPAGRLPVAVSGGATATVGSTAYLIGGTGAGGAPLQTVVTLGLRRERIEPEMQSPASADGSYPFAGRLLIADRGNNRLIVVNARKQVLWRFPSRVHPAPPGGFYFPDDAFFTHGGAGIVSNEEQNERIVQLAFPSGKLLWSYGHPGTAGSEPGYLHEPDDAYLWRNGTVSVADAQNCRVLLISHRKKVLEEIGSPAACTHEPPRYLGSPNGDTPLRDGNILVSEVNGSYIDEIAPTGKLVWSVQLPIAYPSDPQQLGPDRYLVADYTSPGGIYEFNRAGKILWSYHPSSGNAMLNHPSLAERLPGGLIGANDDYRHRVVIINPRTRKIVWQYGHTDSPGRGPGYLRIPDGFDLLAPGGTTPTHPFTG
ncbi:MAG TPA: PQQ-binding-like beta-propeller repeat protein [Solirubrobacterales bacterium]|nr:PQQ-binding-like beta-propeller repeat protein [Solirubrobacterales bacterium]